MEHADFTNRQIFCVSKKNIDCYWLSQNIRQDGGRD
jgi:hypothetical protein